MSIEAVFLWAATIGGLAGTGHAIYQHHRRRRWLTTEVEGD